MIHLLIDENLSPRLVDLLSGKGIFSQHAAHVGLSGRPDPQVWEWALEHDMAVATINARDFLMLASGSELHAGLIVLRESGMTRAEQWARLEPVVDRLLADQDDLVNRVVDVIGVGDFTIRDLPRS